MEDFQKELSELLKKHNVSIVCANNKNEDNLSVEIGFQDNKFKNHWTGRHHLTSYDIELKK